MHRLAPLLFLLTVIGLRAEDWKPIPKEAWAIKDGAQGAVVLEESVRYGLVDSEFRLRIRIFRESGKTAGNLPAFNSKLAFLKGRIVYPDGRTSSYDDRKDFLSREMKIGDTEARETVVIPPGLTEDCIVDLHWGEHGSPLDGTYSKYTLPLLGPFPIVRFELRTTTQTPMYFVLLGAEGHPPKVTEDGEYRIYTFEGLPAKEPVPFTVDSARENPRLYCFTHPWNLDGPSKKGPDAFWSAACKENYKNLYTREIGHGEGYRRFADQILAHLPSDPLEKAQEILVRLEKNILNISTLSFVEQSRWSKEKLEEPIHSLNLDETVERMWTDGEGIFFLCFQLLSDAGLDPKLYFVVDRDQGEFNFRVTSTKQFTDVLLGVERSDKKGVGLVDPSRRFLPPGVIDPSFQSTRALQVDPRDWSFKVVGIPAQPSAINQLRYLAEIEMDGENESFKTSATFAGYPEYRERSEFLRLEPKDQSRKLRERLGSLLKNYTIGRAEVLHAQDYVLNLSWEAEGSREIDAPSRHAVQPFPGVPDPLPIPASWPEKRTEGIVLPFCRIHSALSRIRIPKGWKATVDPDIREENGFGKVSWMTRTVQEGEDRILEIRFVVDASRMVAPASEYEPLKVFIGWIEKGARRRVLLQKDR